MHEFLAGVSGTATSLVTLLLAVFIGIWVNNRGLDKLEAKMDARFDNMDARFEKMDARFDKMDVKFDKLSEKLSSMFADQAVQEYRLQLLEKPNGRLVSGYEIQIEGSTAMPDPV